jgi:hypothetical protein
VEEMRSAYHTLVRKSYGKRLLTLGDLGVYRRTIKNCIGEAECKCGGLDSVPYVA